MKQLAKSTLERYPRLKANRLYYEMQLLRDRTQARPDPARFERPDVIETIRRDGFVVIPDWADPAAVTAAADALRPWFDGMAQGTVEEATQLPPEEHFYYRLAGTNEKVPETRFFYESPFVHGAAHAYLSPRAEPYRFEAERRSERRTRVSAEDLFHFDSWRPMFKAFLYLVDVGPENGPFVYLKGSHQSGKWKRKRALEFDVEGDDGSLGHFFPGEVQHLQRAYGFEEVAITGKAGTLIMGDYRGLHRGSPLIDGERVMLNMVFGIQDWAF